MASNADFPFAPGRAYWETSAAVSPQRKRRYEFTALDLPALICAGVSGGVVVQGGVLLRGLPLWLTVPIGFAAASGEYLMAKRMTASLCHRDRDSASRLFALWLVPFAICTFFATLFFIRAQQNEVVLSRTERAVSSTWPKQRQVLDSWRANAVSAVQRAQGQVQEQISSEARNIAFLRQKGHPYSTAELSRLRRQNAALTRALNAARTIPVLDVRPPDAATAEREVSEAYRRISDVWLAMPEELRPGVPKPGLVQVDEVPTTTFDLFSAEAKTLSPSFMAAIGTSLFVESLHLVFLLAAMPTVPWGHRVYSRRRRWVELVDAAKTEIPRPSTRKVLSITVDRVGWIGTLTIGGNPSPVVADLQPHIPMLETQLAALAGWSLRVIEVLDSAGKVLGPDDPLPGAITLHTAAASGGTA